MTYQYLTIRTQPYLIADHSSIAALPLVSKYLSYLPAFSRAVILSILNPSSLSRPSVSNLLNATYHLHPSPDYLSIPFHLSHHASTIASARSMRPSIASLHVHCTNAYVCAANRTSFFPPPLLPILSRVLTSSSRNSAPIQALLVYIHRAPPARYPLTTLTQHSSQANIPSRPFPSSPSPAPFQYISMHSYSPTHVSFVTHPLPSHFTSLQTIFIHFRLSLQPYLRTTTRPAPTFQSDLYTYQDPSAHTIPTPISIPWPLLFRF